MEVVPPIVFWQTAKVDWLERDVVTSIHGPPEEAWQP